MRIGQKFTFFLLIILFLSPSGVKESSGDSVSRYRFYDTHNRLAAEKELDWRIRQNKSELLRLEFEGYRPRFNSDNLDDYPDYLNRSERHFMTLLTKQEETLSAPYLSCKAIRDISDGFRSQAGEVAVYYDEKRMEYHDYLTQLYQSRKSSPTPLLGFVVGGIVTCLTGGTAAPILLASQAVKLGVDGMLETAYGPRSESQTVFDFFYGFGMSGFGALHGGWGNATKLWNSGEKLAGAVQYVQITNDLFHPITNELAREDPDSFFGRGLPGIMAGLSLYSNVNRTANVPKGRYLSESCWRYPESVFRIGSAVSDIVTIDYAVGGKESWSATHPNSSFYLQQGCRLTDAGQTVIATHLGTKEFNKAAEVTYAQASAVADMSTKRKNLNIVGNNGVVPQSLITPQGLEGMVDSASAGPYQTEKNAYQLAKNRYRMAENFLETYVGEMRFSNPVQAIQQPFLFTCGDFSDFEEISSYLSDIFPSSKIGSATPVSTLDSNSLASFSLHRPGNFGFPGGHYSVFNSGNGTTYRDYLDKGICSELNVGNFGEYTSGSFWLEKGCLLGAYRAPETFSLDWENKLAKADPEAFNLIQGLEVKGPYGEIWKVSMIGGARNIDGTFICGLSQGFWSAGIDRHGQILPTGSGLLVDTRHQNYYAQLSKGFAPERTDWTSNFTHDWRGNYLFNQSNQPAKNFFEDFDSPFLEDFTPQTIAQKYDPWLQNYTLYGGGVEQLQDALGKAVTYNRTDSPIEMLPVLGRRRSIEAGEFWRVEPGQATIGNLKTGEVKEYSLSGRGGELILSENPTPVEVYTGEWRDKTREKIFEGNQFEAREGFRQSVLNMDRHLNTGMTDLVKGLQDGDKKWIEQSEENFAKLGNDKEQSIAQARTERKVLDISEIVIGTREHPKIDLSFYKDSEGKVVGYSYLPHERELHDSRGLIDKKTELLPKQQDIDRLQEGSEGYGRIIDKKGKDLLSFVCGLGQTKTMENVLEGSQRIHSRLVDLTRTEQDIVFLSNEFTRIRSELIGETVKFIARENKLSLFSLIPIFSRSSLEVNYSLKIVLGKDKFEFVDYPVKWGFQWEVAKSFESAPKAKDKFTLKLDPIDKRASQSWGGQWAKFTFDGTRSSLTFPLYEGYFLSGRLDLTASYGHAKKIEFLEATFLEISHADTFRVNEKFICDMALAYFLAHGILAVPYAVPAPVTVGSIFISPSQLIPSSENLQEE